MSSAKRASPTSAGIVYLVGAGPGDPGLITVAGLEAVRQADVIVYDRLVSPRLLDHAREDAELVYVGKISGAPGGHDQAAINALLVEKAREGRRVVRLKGGDPFVFGRGGEEAEALRAAGVPFRVVPGVTSAVAVPAYAGIPVTHRGVAATFAVVTGHEADDVILSGDDARARSSASSRRHVLSEAEGNLGRGSGRTQSPVPPAIDWERLATAVDTLVLLMGVKTLPDVVEKLIAGGRPAETPVAVIRWGTTPDQRTVIGTLADIVRRVEEAGIEPPAITVVGEVVRLRETLRWFEDRPLFGKRVLITRTRRQASALARLLAEEGAVPVELPVIEIEPSFDDAAVAAALQALTAGAYAWAVFTSANAVELWFELMRERGLDARAFGRTAARLGGGVRVAAIGPATAEALAERGIVADTVPEEYIAEGLVAALAGPSPVIPSGDAGLARGEAGAGTTPREAEARLPARPEALEGPSGVTTPLPARPEALEGTSGATTPLLRPGDRVLVPRAESARPELVEGLSALGAEVDEVTLYRAAVPSEAPAEALAALRDGGIDIVTFTSSSTVRNLAALLGDDFRVILSGEDAGAGNAVSSRRPVLSEAEGNLGSGEGGVATDERARPLIACIGPITADTARELGLRVDVVASEHTVPGLVAALRERVSKETGHAIV
ncbi:MAG: uroporphyrinogen-III C-methyltransferase [Dehalococcoidia bacterium]|nr:uroporphyrinogen-III C-methyltransferase [Dehalococcoidia bacterium]